MTIDAAGGTGAVGLEALRAGRIEDGDARLRATADLLEGVFYQELFKAMRETVPESGLTGGNAQEVFSSMMDQHVAESAAARAVDGLGDALYHRLRGGRNEP